MSREKVSDEITAELIEHIRELISYWESTESSSLEKLNGLAFSILVALDGSGDNLPSFIIAPSPHPEDKQFNIERDNNYYPENHELENYINGDIGGSLHELFIRVREKDVKTILAKSEKRHDERYKKLMKD
jgi:hypothetical protein